eukprot:CAMPEP_0119116792 /NCGR_PEP_ID=MMETSP1180-20130426/52481_1 /TAXON_ID=3052 ORGANISM="Chlamydomonas cf sp, Strain CCMP681" /NCGR_SAMPLE_ID=MMETSP1180 /ASSEMBLY_ACC=CAM_ASM_000741 /LENGTH=51 /DNA_ID=CAMNT_0007105981 /DNA_START=2310 /DNA_END=2465 /DNA_ORIENTATION=+
MKVEGGEGGDLPNPGQSKVADPRFSHIISDAKSVQAQPCSREQLEVTVADV